MGESKQIKYLTSETFRVMYVSKESMVCPNYGKVFKVFEWEQGSIVGWIVTMN